MALHHIIPKFILRNFCVNPDADRKEQEIMIYDAKENKLHKERINFAYAIENFNSDETEKKLCEYENKISNLFNRIKHVVDNNGPFVEFNDKEYKLLIKFFTIMWRRNSKHIKDNMQHLPEDLKSLFYSNKELFTKLYYDLLINSVTDEDDVVIKTIDNYQPTIINNITDKSFLLHNTYATLRYMVKNGEQIQENDMPFCQIFPISKQLCLTLWLNEWFDLKIKKYQIPIEEFDKTEIVEYFIKGYIQENAISYIVDETNLKYVRGY